MGMGCGTPINHSLRVKSPEAVLAWRRQTAGSVVVVTGTFDVFQPGNLFVLKQARAAADRVIVVVEPDELAARHSAPGRPQNNLETRVEMVSYLRDVDVVTTVAAGEAPAFFAGLKPFIRVTATTHKESECYAGALKASELRVVEVPPQKGCFTEEIIAAMTEHRTPINVPRECASVIAGRNDVEFGGVTVNGCFDILHIGHLRFLAEARSMGASLTVLINSDASVRRYKGPTRPVFPETFRSTALMAVDCVSEVRVFQGDNPLEEIGRLRPELHVKGGSFEPDRVKDERDLVESWGGRLVCTPMVEGFSTTAYIRKALGHKA